MTERTEQSANGSTEQSATGNSLQAVLFDLDGTLLDTAPDFVRSLNQLRQEEGLSALPYATIRNRVSNGAGALVTLGFGINAEHPDFPRLHQRLLHLYSAGLADESRLFDGMEQVLTWLEARAIPWGIVTNKPLQYSAPLLEGLDLEKRCAVLICPDHVTHRKPHPEPLFLAAERLGCTPAACLYVGDHARDIESGRRAGMVTAAALFGYLDEHSNPLEWGSDHLVDTPDALLNILRAW